jgi:4-amino-4-deoxy-L-arabinose transferase-like glycosyltransferase
MPASPALRRYNKRVILFCAAYACALFGGVGYFKNHPGAHGVTAYFAAIVPALAIIGVFFAIGRYLIEEADEYLRMLMVRQTLIATAFALSLATLWGFLNSFDLAPRIDSYYVAVVWFGGLGIGSCINKIMSGREA